MNISYHKTEFSQLKGSATSNGQKICQTKHAIIAEVNTDYIDINLTLFNVPAIGWGSAFFAKYSDGGTIREDYVLTENAQPHPHEALINAIDRIIERVEPQKKPNQKETLKQLGDIKTKLEKFKLSDLGDKKPTTKRPVQPKEEVKASPKVDDKKGLRDEIKKQLGDQIKN